MIMVHLKNNVLSYCSYAVIVEKITEDSRNSVLAANYRSYWVSENVY